MRKLLMILLVGLFTFGTAVCGEAGASDEVKERRVKLAETMGDNALLVLFPEPQKGRINDVSWPYAPSKDLYYLTGDPHIGSHLVMVKTGGKVYEHFFAKISDPEFEVWDGKLLSKEDFQHLTGIDDVRDENTLHTIISRILLGRSFEKIKDRNKTPPYLDFYHKTLAGQTEIWLNLGRDRDFTSDAPLTSAQKFAGQIRTQYPEIKIRNITPAIHLLRQVKSDAELEKLQTAIDITDKAQLAVMKAILMVDAEYEVEAEIERVFRREGACCTAFDSTVASGVNGTILHYVTNNEKLGRQDILVTDIGAEYLGYSADITRTYPVSGVYSQDQKTIYNIVLKAQRAAIAQTRRGSNFDKISKTAEDIIGKELLVLGLIEENNYEQVKSYFLHSIGHGLGLDVHDAFEYYMEFEKNMVIAVEPGIYVRKQDVVEKKWFKALSQEKRTSIIKALDIYDGIGVRIEDDVVVTRGTPTIMSSGSPVTIEAIEAMMAKLKSGVDE